MASYSPPLDQLLPTMHAVVVPLASALCVFFFGTQHGRNTWVHYLAAHRTATHRRVRPSMVVVWALLDVSRHFIVRPLTLASPRPGPAHLSARPEIRWSRKPRLPFRSHGQQRHNGLPYYSTDCDDENSKFRSPSPAKDLCTNACAGKARSRGTRCRDVIFETLFATLWVTNPIRPRSAASRNRVMRGPGVTQGAKRSQGARRRRVSEPRNALSARADVVRWTEGHLAASQRPWRRRPRRGRGPERVACVRVGFPGTREASSSPS